MKEFNLERALAGYPVITRDGRAVTQLHKFDAADSSYQLIGVIGELIFDFTIDGYSSIGREVSHDLFMAPNKVTLYLNFGLGFNDYPVCVGTFDTADRANKQVNSEIILRAIPVKVEL